MPKFGVSFETPALETPFFKTENQDWAQEINGVHIHVWYQEEHSVRKAREAMYIAKHWIQAEADITVAEAHFFRWRTVSNHV